eukprot:1157983-Pelagomonas_calceolata.AAC.5
MHRAALTPCSQTCCISQGRGSKAALPYFIPSGKRENPNTHALRLVIGYHGCIKGFDSILKMLLSICLQQDRFLRNTQLTSPALQPTCPCCNLAVCFYSGVNDVELSLELAGMALHLSTGYYYDAYGDVFLQQMGYRHTG